MEAINNLINSGAVEDVLFYVFAALTLLCGVLVVANPFSRSPVTSAMFLVLTIISMSGLFVLLHAFFLAAVQILVYAGAVMVLFLFVIMLLDLKEEARRKIKLFGFVAGLISVGAVLTIFIKSLTDYSSGFFPSQANGKAPLPPTLEGDTIALGEMLFKHYTLPFEIVSVLLLVAMVGVILLSKKKLE
jgi:NADH-quinone oxidoreductase subunit J